jgi:hypothetical protein
MRRQIEFPERYLQPAGKVRGLFLALFAFTANAIPSAPARAFG